MIKVFYDNFKCLFWQYLSAVLISLLLIGAAHAENLKDIFAAANLQNPDLLSARLRVLNEAETIEQAYGAVRPQLHIAINGALHSLTEENKEAAERYESNEYGDITTALVLNQQIYAGGALWAAVDVASASLQAVLQDLRATEQDIFLQTMIAYADYITARATYDARNQNVERLAQHLQMMRRSFELGRANRTDMLLAESRHASALAERDTAQARYDESELEYIRIVGEPPQQNKLLPMLPDEALDYFTNSSAESLIELALQNHPSAKAAELQMNIAKDTIRLRNAEHYPQVSASASLQHNDSDAPMRPDNEQSVVLRGQVMIPLYSGGTTSSKVRAARYNHRRQQQNYTATKRQVTKVAGSARRNYLAALSGLEARQVAMESAKLALQGIVSEYDLGSRSFLDLLDNEQNYTDAAIAQTRAEGDLFVALFRLRAATGDLTTVKLELHDPMSEVAAAIGKNKNILRSIRKTDRDGALELPQEENQ